MPTTIQIDDETKKKLFKIKLKLEEQKGNAISYNDLIEYLLENHPLNMIRKISLQEFRSLKGFLPKSAQKMYVEEKRKELIREEKRAPLKTTQK
ncbi:hypothetical protein LCGC14_2460740 [marine sediment metagenome]|uniref:Uncharacterized protein n=1 Tax=marine sediment metagenome TaxID=412755 RepID=A0A0F9C114_9ZZZZ